MKNPISLKNKRILIFLRSFDVGGAEKQAVMLANYLYKKEKAKVTVWAYSKPGPILKFLNPNINWQSVPFDPETHLLENREERIKNLKKLALKILFLRPHIILPFTIGPNADCGCIWRWTLAKSCVWNQRDEWLDFLENPDKKVEKYGFANTPVFISNSQKAKKKILDKLKELRRTDEQVFYIPNAIKLSPSKLDRKAWRKKIGAGESSTIVTMVGNLHKDKGHETLLRVWELLLKKVKNPSEFLLILAGRFDNNYQNLKNLAKELKIQKQIKFLGYTDDISGLLEASDIGVFLSRSEGCPNAVLESIEAKLPIVISDIKAHRDIFGKKYKFYADMEKLEEITDRLMELIQNKKLRISVKKDNFELTQQKFKPDKIFEEYCSVIKKAIFQYKSPITPKNIFQILKWQLSWKKPNLWESIS